MEAGICHDLKTERREVSQGLPPYMRLVPIAFYVSMVGCALLSVWFYLGYKGAKSQSETASLEATQFESQAGQVGRERDELEKLNLRAGSTADWVEGAHGLQPLAVVVGRSVGDKATISELNMTRNSEIPAQILFTLKMDGVSSSVMDSTLDGVRALNFKAYSAEQTKKGDSLDYNATLVYQGPNK